MSFLGANNAKHIYSFDTFSRLQIKGCYRKQMLISLGHMLITWCQDEKIFFELFCVHDCI